MGSQQQSSNTPIASRDSWQTPQWLFDYVRSEQGFFDIDLAANKSNAKVPYYFSLSDNSLSLDWFMHASHGWCNPPYSETGKWLEKGKIEAQKGFKSVFLVPTPNGDSYWKHVFGWAAEIIFINGRIGFIASESYTVTDKKGRVKHIKKGDEVPGNSRGSCLVVFDGIGEQDTQISWVDRDTMKAIHNEEGIS